MNEIKRKVLYAAGVIATAVTVVIGAYTAFIVAVTILFDGVAGSQKTTTESGFLMGFIPFVAIAVLSFVLGSYLRDNYRKTEQ
jgi:H+/Cl- antiporter ClcA